MERGIPLDKLRAVYQRILQDNHRNNGSELNLDSNKPTLSMIIELGDPEEFAQFMDNEIERRSEEHDITYIIQRVTVRKVNPRLSSSE
ncbi:MAG: hypothetical protein AABX59_00755 [Nanoarchaeota archaeon]